MYKNMKRIFIIALAVAVSASAWAQDLKFAHVNFSELVQLMPESDTAREQIEVMNKETQETYQAMIEEFQNKYQQYEQKQASWTPAVKQSKEKELNDIQTRIQEFEQTAQQDLQQQQNRLMAPIYQKAQTTVSEIAKAAGYIYVFDATAVLYIDATRSTDITAEARKALGIPEDRTLESLQAELQARAQQPQP